jgi:hypothetical protein
MYFLTIKPRHLFCEYLAIFYTLFCKIKYGKMLALTQHPFFNALVRLLFSPSSSSPHPPRRLRSNRRRTLCCPRCPPTRPRRATISCVRSKSPGAGCARTGGSTRTATTSGCRSRSTRAASSTRAVIQSLLRRRRRRRRMNCRRRRTMRICLRRNAPTFR